MSKKGGKDPNASSPYPLVAATAPGEGAPASEFLQRKAWSGQPDCPLAPGPPSSRLPRGGPASELHEGLVEGGGCWGPPDQAGWARPWRRAGAPSVPTCTCAARAAPRGEPGAAVRGPRTPARAEGAGDAEQPRARRPNRILAEPPAASEEGRGGPTRRQPWPSTPRAAPASYFNRLGKIGILSGRRRLSSLPGLMWHRRHLWELSFRWDVNLHSLRDRLSARSRGVPTRGGRRPPRARPPPTGHGPGRAASQGHARRERGARGDPGARAARGRRQATAKVTGKWT